jgi:hypothetical protein
MGLEKEENMYFFGRTIYFDKSTGFVIHDTGDVAHTDMDYEIKRNDYEAITVLSERVRETIGEIKLEYEQLKQDFESCNGYRVNPTTLQLEFSYRDPSNPDPEPLPVFQKPLSEQISENTEYLVDVDYRLSLVELGLK